tara:strand:+ start:216 stop:548 length:333 start_codon:yes stop_codon:yes gene_type:complete
MKLGKNNIDVVTILLKSSPIYRDDDNKLIARIWHETLKINNIDTEDITALKFLEILGTNGLPSAESIRRSRQKVQEHNKSLRGEKWKKRQAHQSNIKNELNIIKHTISGD